MPKLTQNELIIVQDIPIVKYALESPIQIAYRNWAKEASIHWWHVKAFIIYDTVTQWMLAQM